MSASRRGVSVPVQSSRAHGETSSGSSADIGPQQLAEYRRQVDSRVDIARGYLDAFAMLRDRHIAPPRWRPRVKAPDVFRFAARLRRKPDLRAAMKKMPPLLRTYLMMGGWVSDHAVIDRDLGTLHVFTGLEIASVPAGRARLLRRLATT